MLLLGLFRGPLPDHELALADEVGAVAPSDLGSAQRLWATVDSPWVAQVDRASYAATVRELGASGLRSSSVPISR